MALMCNKYYVGVQKIENLEWAQFQKPVNLLRLFEASNFFRFGSWLTLRIGG